VVERFRERERERERSGTTVRYLCEVKVRGVNNSKDMIHFCMIHSPVLE
jgi:hypothetical protein